MKPVKTKPLPSPSHFRQKMLLSFLFAAALIAFSLGLGILGYHHYCSFNWVDALLNASMILTGMGPVNVIDNDAGKFFASFYALYSGIAFLTIFAVFFSPIFHRFLHKMHLDTEEEN